MFCMTNVDRALRITIEEEEVNLLVERGVSTAGSNRNNSKDIEVSERKA